MRITSFSQDRLLITNLIFRSKYLRQFKEEDYRVVFKNSLEGRTAYLGAINHEFGSGALLEEMVMVLEQLVNRGDNPEIIIRQASVRAYLK